MSRKTRSKRALNHSRADLDGRADDEGKARRAGPPKPKWNNASRELWFGETLVKRFRRPAPIAELILSAFQEEGWPERIDDPLPPLTGTPEATR